MVMLGLGLYTFAVCIYGFLISTRESRGVVRGHNQELAGVTIRDSNEGYPMVRNHGEGPY